MLNYSDRVSFTMFKILKKIQKEIPQETRDITSHKNNLLIPSCCEPSKKLKNSGDNFFVHIHLPKTGGTCFNKFLKSNFNELYEPYEGKFIHFMPIIDHEKILKFISIHSKIRAMSSHMLSVVLPWQASNKKIIAIAFIRNPIEQFFSFYFHMRHMPGYNGPETYLVLEKYIEYKLNNYLTSCGKFTGYLNTLTKCEENETNFKYVELLVKNKHLHLFNTDKMDLSCKLLNTYYPKDFMKIPFPLDKQNISQKDQIVTDQMKETIRRRISVYDWKLMELTS